MLQASGALNLKMGGRPVVPPVDREELYGLSQSPDSMWIVTADPEEQRRRSVYMLSRRTFRPAMFENFDAPDGIRTCSRREASNTAPQSLTLLNGRWTNDESQRLAAIVTEATSDRADVVKGLGGRYWVASPMPQNSTGDRNSCNSKLRAGRGSRPQHPSWPAGYSIRTNFFTWIKRRV